MEKESYKNSKCAVSECGGDVCVGENGGDGDGRMVVIIVVLPQGRDAWWWNEVGWEVKK